MLNPDFRDLLSAFAACGVEYLLVGAQALSAHGIVRATGDMDVWVRATTENAGAARRALLEFGAPADSFSESDLSQPDVVLQFGVEPVRIDVLTSLSGVDFATAWDARLDVEIDGLRIPVIGRAELIANKRATGRPRDLLDVEELESPRDV